jgi:hypothetical protein
MYQNVLSGCLDSGARCVYFFYNIKYILLLIHDKFKQISACNIFISYNSPGISCDECLRDIALNRIEGYRILNLKSIYQYIIDKNMQVCRYRLKILT